MQVRNGDDSVIEEPLSSNRLANSGNESSSYTHSLTEDPPLIDKSYFVADGREIFKKQEDEDEDTLPDFS